jgi:hypothetical protein
MKNADQKLASLVKEACSAEKTIKRQVAHVRRALTNDPKLQAALLEELITAAIQTSVYSRRHTIRTTAKYQAAKPCPRGAEAILSTKGTVAQSLLDSWQMHDGRSLGEWTGVELLREAAQEATLEDGHRKNKQFYTTLGERAGRKMIRNVITGAEVDSIWAKIDGAIKKKQAA